MRPATGNKEDRRARSEWVTRNVSLLDVRLSKLNAELKNPAPAMPLQTEDSFGRVEWDLRHGLLIYYLSYGFTARDRNKRVVWEASFVLSLSFRVPSDFEIDDDVLRDFGAVAVVEIAHPYARELIHQVTGRMRVPALILEVLPARREDQVSRP
jgi:hypothetical protein